MKWGRGLGRQATRPRGGGRLLLGDRDPQQAQGAVLLSGARAQGGRDILRTRHAEQADGEVAERGHHLRARALAHAAAVLVKAHVAHVVHFVLDAPVVAAEG